MNHVFWSSHHIDFCSYQFIFSHVARQCRVASEWNSMEDSTDHKKRAMRDSRRENPFKYPIMTIIMTTKNNSCYNFHDYIRIKRYEFVFACYSESLRDVNWLIAHIVFHMYLFKVKVIEDFHRRAFTPDVPFLFFFFFFKYFLFLFLEIAIQNY